MFASRLRIAASAGFGVAVGVATIEVFRNRGTHAVYQVKAAIPRPELNKELLDTVPANTDILAKFKHLGLLQSNIILVPTRANFVTIFNARTRTPDWVFEHLNRATLEKSADPCKRASFYQDKRISQLYGPSNSDYRGSGFDRGHMAPAKNHCRSPEELKETFSLCNVAPQVGEDFNQGIWNNLERHIRSLTSSYENVYVCTGVLYEPKCVDGKMIVSYEVIGKNHVAVPTHFFKVAVGETASGEMDLEAYRMPNEAIDKSKKIEDFKVPLQTIERSTGVKMFYKIRNFRNINGRPTLEAVDKSP